MQASRSTRIAGAVGLCLLTVPLVRQSLRPLSSPSASAPGVAPPPRSPSEAARRTARRCWVRAQVAVNRQREALEAWDPAAADNVDQEAWRRQSMALDPTLPGGDPTLPGGDLRRAVEAARRAAALAHTPEEAYAAALLLTRLECDAGHHAAELEQARKLLALRPHHWLSLLVLRRAAVCNGMEPLARRVTAELRGLQVAIER